MKSFENKQATYKENLEDKEININEVMSDTKDRLRPILLQLKDDIEANKIGMVLGIDGSGRVPALIMSRVLKYSTQIETRFVTGNKNIDNEDHVDRLEELTAYFSSDEFKGQLGDREVIIIDDIVASGQSINLTCEALKRAGIRYRVCALSLEYSKQASDKNEIEQFLDAEVIVGNTGTPIDNEYPEIYGKRKMSGVKKGVGMHGESIALQNRRLSGLISVNPDEDSRVLKITREKVEEIAQELASELGWKN